MGGTVRWIGWVALWRWIGWGLNEDNWNSKSVGRVLGDPAVWEGRN